MGSATDLVIGGIEQACSFGHGAVRSLDRKAAAASRLGYVPSQQFASCSTDGEVSR